MKCFGDRRKKRRNVLCKIVLLDETQIIHEIQESSHGQDIIFVVCKHLNLLETAYFGLRYVDSTNQTRWLHPSRNVTKELEGCHPVTLYFGVKYYPIDPCKLLEEITRYQFFLQLKQDILHSRLPVPIDLAPELFAYAIQSELGDFDSSLHKNGYVSEFRFVPNQTRELETRVSELHKRLTGQVPASAELAFLDRVKWLDLYGGDLHPVLGEDNVEYYVALVPRGVLVLRNKATVTSYSWSDVSKFHRKGKFFMLKVSDKNNQEKTIGFELPSESAAKHLDSCCSDQQAFFSLTGNSKESSSFLSGNPVNRVLGLSQRFRGSFSGGRVGSIGKASTLDALHVHNGRSTPSIVRVPSKRYQRRPQISHEESTNGKDVASSGIVSVSTGQSVLEDNRVWDGNQAGLLTGKSPYHTDSLRHRSCSRTRQSDTESQVSRSSRHSHRSHRSKSSHRSHCRHRHGSHLSENELSDSGGSTRRRRHRRRHRSSRDESTDDQLVDSRPQWLEIQKLRENTRQSLEPQQAKVISIQQPTAPCRNVTQSSKSSPSQDTELILEGDKQEARIESTKIKNVSTARKNFIPDEVRRFIENNLVDPTRQNEANDLTFTQLEADDRYLKIRYSPTTGRAKCKLTSNNDYEQDPLYSNIGNVRLDNDKASNITTRTAGSRAPVCVDTAEFDLSFESLPPKTVRENEMATEL